MRTDGDYISREEAIKRFTFATLDCLGMEPTICASDVVLALQSIPAADVVEVVRCKDCKYSERWYRDKRLCRLWYGEEKPSAPIDVFEDGFCNYGERREDDG